MCVCVCESERERERERDLIVPEKSVDVHKNREGRTSMVQSIAKAIGATSSCATSACLPRATYYYRRAPVQESY